MAKLLFFDKEHQYELNDEIVPSVSEISRFASREVYGDINQYTLDNAANRGTSIHKATEILDKYDEVECDSETEPYIRAYIQFRHDYAINEYKYIEKATASEKLKFAGTIDRIVEITEEFAKIVKKELKVDLTDSIGKLAIIDLKSSYTIHKPLCKIQLNAYKILAEENDYGEVDALFILHLQKDGSYKFVNFDIDDKLFMACYTLHKEFEKKPRKKGDK